MTKPSTNALTQDFTPRLTIVELPDPAVAVPPPRPLAITRVEVSAIIFGYNAETRMTLVFANDNDRALAGDLIFPLPEGATVSGYALDINGVMVDGVVVEKQKGRQVFEKIVRQGLDPGLVEAVSGNNFKTRVFPIPARGSRTVMVRYVTEIPVGPDHAVYHLPLAFSKEVRELSLRVEVVKSRVEPKLKTGGPANFRFAKWQDSFVAEARLAGSELTGDLVVELPIMDRAGLAVEQGQDGDYYFCLDDFPDLPRDQGPEIRPRKVTVLWDGSGSRGRSDHQRELGLLETYLKSLGQAEVRVDLVVFAHELVRRESWVVKNGEASPLLEALSQVRYDGGTRLGSLNYLPGDKPDLYLLFSDGQSNFGKSEALRFQAPLFALCDEAGADHGVLRALAAGSGGAYFNLKRLSEAEVLDHLLRPSATLLSWESSPGLAEVQAGMGTGPGRFRLTGRLTGEAGTLTLNYGRPGEIMVRSRVNLSRAEAAPGRLVQTCWAQMRLENLKAEPGSDQGAAAMLALGQKYGLVTPGSSLIVLDSLEQYLEHQIEPPAGLTEMRKSYLEIMDQRRKDGQKQAEDKIWHILELWKRRVNWWQKEYQYPPDFKFVEPDQGRGVGAGMPGAPLPPPEAVMADFEEIRRPDLAAMDMGTSGAEPEAAVMSAPSMESPVSAKQAEAGPAEAAIAIQPWDPDTPYLNRLKGAAPEDWENIYWDQRQDYVQAPAFFLDCAGFFLDRGRPELGIRVLSNLAELELENAALLRVLGYRLAQAGELDSSLAALEKVLAMRPEEPQSYRDLALVLSRRGERILAESRDPARAADDFKRAVELLCRVIMNRWDRFDEIEVIALMELNRLIPLARRAGIMDIPLDPLLIRLLDVDLRVVLSWDADMTDIDLWVTEPSGERAFYGHAQTTIGGLVSRDIRDGYGPEEYLVRRAMPGKYKIEANYFGSRSAEIMGGVTVTAEVFTNFARPEEKQRSLTLRLTQARETVVVGEVEFGKD
jgi:tetratricopeptide (TPR) repeat protein